MNVVVIKYNTAKDRERKDTEKDKNNTQRQFLNKNEESSERPKKTTTKNNRV